MREDEVRKMEQKHQDIREEFAERLRVLEEKMQHTQENVCAPRLTIEAPWLVDRSGGGGRGQQRSSY
jgi:hypothetical protein